jgi:hypothetical protein
MWPAVARALPIPRSNRNTHPQPLLLPFINTDAYLGYRTAQIVRPGSILPVKTMRSRLKILSELPEITFA